MGLMADATQLLTIGMPTLAVLVGILVNNSRLADLNSRFAEMRAYMDRRFDDERRYNDVMFKGMMEKLDDIDGRLSRLEARFAR